MNTFQIAVTVAALWLSAALLAPQLMKAKFAFLKNPSWMRFIFTTALEAGFIAVYAAAWIGLSHTAGWWQWLETMFQISAVLAGLAAGVVNGMFFYASKSGKVKVSVTEEQ